MIICTKENVLAGAVLTMVLSGFSMRLQPWPQIILPLGHCFLNTCFMANLGPVGQENKSN